MTHAFTQITLGHLLSNCIGIYFIGRELEKVLGSRTFLKVYFTGILIGAFLQLLRQDYYTPMIGASNGVSAIFSFFALTFPQAKFYLFPFPIPVKAWHVLVLYTFISLGSVHQGGSVGHAGHLGGLLTGLIFKFWKIY